jgi:predicted lipoprotein with Yx(FWY)xxD motif
MLKYSKLLSLALAGLVVASAAGCDLLSSDDDSNDGTEAQVTVAENDTYGAHLADAEGRSLYLFTDGNGNPVSCTGQCAEVWPPLTVEGEVTGADGMDTSRLSTTERADGSAQVVYDGWPLYRFANDQSSGDVNGQGITSFGGTWLLVSPSGEKIESGDGSDDGGGGNDGGGDNGGGDDGGGGDGGDGGRYPY